MKPERESCLVEVLDRLLNKGAVLNADLIISVAGIPMIGLNLRAVLASIETMLDYGMMEAWDKSTREWYSSHESRHLHFDGNEEILFKAFGYLWQDHGIVSSWLPGIWHITTKRLILWRRTPGDIVFDVPLHNICVLKETAHEEFDEERFELEITYSEGTVRIYLSEMDEFLDALERASSSVRMIDA